MLSVAEVKPNLLKISDTLSVRFQKIGSGPPLLLIHTIRTQLEYFRSLAPLLAKSHTVYVIDLPGVGKAQKRSLGRSHPARQVIEQPIVRELYPAALQDLR
jgi:pimeloyl-ACP methyl ester carboxylesterase